MATESVIAAQQPANSTSQLIYSTSDKTAANNSTDMKNDSDLEKGSRNSTSCDEESTDELGKLVIDLENDNETDKNNKDMVPLAGSQLNSDGRATPVRNNNNNNSVFADSACSNKYPHSSGANKIASSSVSKSLSSYTQSEGSAHSSKNSKSKSKKSNKTNKTNASTNVSDSLSHSSGSRISSSTASFNGTVFVSSNVNSRKHPGNLDAKSALTRTSSSSDEILIGKKVKSSKSKSHHKKHRHGEKNSSVHGGSKSDTPGEKSKSKSKHNNHPQSSAFTSSMSTLVASNGAHVLPALVSGTSSCLAVPNKLNTSFRRSASPKLDKFANYNSLPQSQKNSQLIAQSRSPACTALGVSTTGSRAKTTQAYNEKDSHTGEGSHTSSAHGRKKHRKNQSPFPLMHSSGIAMKTGEPVNNAQQKAFNSSQQSNGGKRDRLSCNPCTNVSTNDVPGMKKMKLDSDGKADSAPKSSSSNIEGNIHPVAQVNSTNMVENNNNPTRKLHSPKPRSLVDIGDASQVSAGNRALDSSSVPVPPPVFAPSSIFAQSMPRYNTTSHGEYASSPVTSSETSSVWSSASSNHKTDASKPNTNTGPPIVNSHRSVGTVTCTSDIGVMTEPDALGPCEPGTSVHLDGIVWHETDTGMLVVNVTWRNRTYVGTLLDATKHDWAPPRFSDNDLDMELRGKSGRSKRARGGIAEATRKGRNRGGAQSVTDDIKGSPSAAAKRRNKNSESEAANTDNDGSSTPRSSKRARLATSRVAKDMTQQLQQMAGERGASGSNGGSGSSTCSSPVFLECPHPKCNRRYKNPNGLKYHQSHAHSESDSKEPEDLKGDGGSSTDQGNLLQEDETRISDPEAATSPDKRGKEADEEGSLKDCSFTDKSKNLPEGLTYKLTTEELNGTVASSGASSTQASSSSLLDEMKRPDNVVSTIPNVLYTETQSHSSLTSTLPLAVAPSITSTTSQDSCSQASSHPVKSIESSVASVASTVASSSQRQVGHHPEASADDNESAQAVQTLLQLQDPDDQFLPGLSAPYSQDSPHPTLSLVSRSGQVSGGESTASYPSSGYPAIPQLQRLPTSEAEVKSTSQFNPHPSQILHPLSSVSTKESLSSSSPAAASSYQGGEEARETTLHLFSSAGALSKDNCTTLVSVPHPHSQGVKMVKGKTVPIPVDPYHSLPSSYAGAASPSSVPGSSKKQKRKKKCDEKSDAVVTTESDSRCNEGSGSSYSSREPHPARHSATTEFSGAPSTVSHYSVAGSAAAAAALNSMAASLQNSQKPQNIALRANESAVLLTSSATAAAAAAHVKSETELRLPPQHLGGRKLPGVVLPATAHPNHFSNNITVTGTFHPHPDPHKPQTAVSAQTQDRIRAGRAVSPSGSDASSNNRNNNNKLAEIQATSSAGKVQQQPETSNAKSRSPATQTTSSQAENTIPRNQDGIPTTRPKYTKPSQWQTPSEFAISKIQNNAENTIAKVYRDMATRGKAVTPVPPDPQRPNEPLPPRTRPSSSEPRPVVTTDDVSSIPNESPPTHRGRPPYETAIEVRDASPNVQAKTPVNEPQPPSNPQVAYMPQIQQIYPAGPNPVFSFSSLGYIHPMDPAYQQMVAAQYFAADPRMKQQYEQYMQDIGKHTYLQQQQQQQQFLAQQQQGEKKIRKPELCAKDPAKQDHSLKSAPQSPGDHDKSQPWPPQHAKRPSTGSPAPSQHQNTKEKSQIGGTLHPSPHPAAGASHPRYKSPQPASVSAMPTRCHSVVTTSPSVPLGGSSHARSDSLDRGRASTREEARLPIRKPSTPPERAEKSPEKPKEGNPSTFRSSAESPYYQAYQTYDPARSAPFRNVQPYAVPPGFQAGFVYPAAGAPAMLQGQTRWPLGPQLPSGKQSPPVKSAKDPALSRTRSPLREDLTRGRQGVKPREISTLQYPMKDRKAREVTNLPVRRLSRSPDPKSLVPVHSGRHSIGGPPPSIEHRPPSPPTQRHHHTHHHIHKGMMMSQYTYPASPVIAGSDAVAAYSVPYPKRD